MCVQDINVQCVLQFTLIHAAGCALHRHTSRVIHRLELCFVSSFRLRLEFSMRIVCACVRFRFRIDGRPHSAPPPGGSGESSKFIKTSQQCRLDVHCSFPRTACYEAATRPTDRLFSSVNYSLN